MDDDFINRHELFRSTQNKQKLSNQRGILHASMAFFRLWGYLAINL